MIGVLMRNLLTFIFLLMGFLLSDYLGLLM